jgi:hypothetical protein
MTKSNRPMVRIHDIKTNEIIDREMNNDEFAQYELDQVTELAKQTEAEKISAKREALLSKLGITEEEAKLLLS